MRTLTICILVLLVLTACSTQRVENTQKDSSSKDNGNSQTEIKSDMGEIKIDDMDLNIKEIDDFDVDLGLEDFEKDLDMLS